MSERIDVVRSRCWRSGILLVCAAVSVSGCTVWIGKHDERVTWDKQTVLTERTVGAPEARLVRHTDGLGWTVELREPIEQTLARTGKRHWQGEPYWVLPGLSLAVAALGCGAGLPMAIIFQGMLLFADIEGEYIRKHSKMLTETCLYPLIGLVHAGKDTPRHGSEPVKEDEHRERGWRPVGDAEAGIRLAGQAWLKYPVDPDGRKSLRVDRLPIAVVPNTPVAVELAVWTRGKQIEDWTEQVDAAAWARVKQEPEIPAARWPRRLTVGVLPWTCLSKDRQAQGERRLLDELTPVVLARHGRLLPLLPATRETLHDERLRQYGGMVAEEKQVSLGREDGATILVKPLAREKGSLQWIGADVLVTETGETLASFGWEIPKEALDGAVEAVIARISRLLEQAPVSHDGKPLDLVR